MKKILIAVDANKFYPGLPDFACYLARLTRSNPTAIFLDKPVAEEIPMLKRTLGASYVETVLASDIPGVREKKELQAKNARLYKEIFDNNGLGCLTQQFHGAPLAELIAESRFADALVVDPQMSFEENPDEVPTRFVKEVLSKSECPVIIAPFSFYGIDEIVFAYDGSCSSMFAMKQFVQLFPDFRNTKVTVLQVVEKENIPQRDKEKVLEFLQRYYTTAEFKLLQGKASDELFGYLLGRKNVFVVMGAFGRGILSDFFRKSAAELVIKAVNLPIFIAHHQ